MEGRSLGGGKLKQLSLFIATILATAVIVLIASTMTANAAVPSSAIGNDLSTEETTAVDATLTHGSIATGYIRNVGIEITGSVSNVSQGDYIHFETSGYYNSVLNNLTVTDNNGNEIGTVYASNVGYSPTLDNYDKYKDVYKSGSLYGEGDIYIVFDKVGEFGLSKIEFDISSVVPYLYVFAMDTSNNEVEVTISLSDTVIASFKDTYSRYIPHDPNRNQTAALITYVSITNGSAKTTSSRITIAAGENNTFEEGEMLTISIDSNDPVLFDYSNIEIGQKLEFYKNRTNNSASKNPDAYQKVSSSGVIFYGNYPTMYATVVSVSETQITIQFDQDFPDDLSGGWEAVLGSNSMYIFDSSAIESSTFYYRDNTRYTFSNGITDDTYHEMRITSNDSSSITTPTTGTLSLYYTDNLGNQLKESVIPSEYSDVELGTDYNVESEEYIPQTIVSNGVTYYYDSSSRDLAGTIKVQDFRIQNIYKAYQFASITYIDKTTGETLGDVDRITGLSGTEMDYSTANRIAEYEAEGYKLVSDEFFDAASDNNAVFDSDVDAEQEYTVKLEHKTSTSEESKTITRTIHYLYENGSNALADKVQTVTYTRTATTDEVTDKVTYTGWSTDNDTFEAVDSQEIDDYYVDIERVEAKAITSSDGDTEVTVTYYPYQLAEVLYIDKDTDNTVLDQYKMSGKSGDAINHNASEIIANYQSLGYKLVTDGFGSGRTFDNDSSNTQTYRIVLEHDLGPVPDDGTIELTKAITRTIDYEYENGETAAKSYKDTVTFTRTATLDKVTNEIVSYSEWTTDDDTFDAVSSPSISGYLADKEQIDALSVDASASDINEIVIYHPLQYASVKYVDEDAENEILNKAEFSGLSNTFIVYTTESQISEYIRQGYILVSDDFPTGEDAIFDSDTTVDQEYMVVLKHGTEESTETKTVARTINYVYSNGNAAAETVVQEVTFTRIATKDLVTEEISYSEWTTDDPVLAEVESPEIKGYKPDIETVEALEVTEESEDTLVTVTYTAKKSIFSDGSSPKTGDVLGLLVWEVIGMISLIITMFFIARRRKESKIDTL